MKSKFTTKSFAENVFDYVKMRKYLPKATFNAIKLAREQNVKLSQHDANVYAEALKKWALSRGITRYTHWFQPLNSLTAEKRDSIISVNKEGGAVIKFGAKQLLRGEGDASSLPNGGLRDTFAARGVTNWDYTAFAFISGDCLRIPTTFCGANGQTLDKKTPLINSSRALNNQALRLLNVLGMPAKTVKSVVGAEQEYFLIDKTLFEKRKDLVYTERTLFGRMAPKGQEFEDHYFRPPTEKVKRFMKEVDVELWKLGIIVKTEHNEVAPCQYELVPCYAEANVACDQNQLVMETLRNVATRQGLACILHEKPFDKINGSGKHNNWSLLADDDCNLLEAGNTPEQNARFLLIIAAIIQALDEYNELLLSSIATASNDLRLGGFEAPPRILTVFLGEQLTAAMRNVAETDWVLGKDRILQDLSAADRNRTSSFAYTGNKFEFRSVGSSAAIADVNTVLNTAVAEILRRYNDELEKAQNVWSSAQKLVADAFTQHRRIIYNGNGYSGEWIEEAQDRGLVFADTVELIADFARDKAIDLFGRHEVLCERELRAIRDVRLKSYCDTVHLEGVVSCEIYERQILPAVENYAADLAKLAVSKQSLQLSYKKETAKLTEISNIQNRCSKLTDKLKSLLNAGLDLPLYDRAELYGKSVRKTMTSLRNTVNKLEQICPKNKWPLPTYGQILFDEK